MNLVINEHHAHLGDSQRVYITEKMDHVLKYLGRMAENEAVDVKVVFTQEDTKSEDDQFLCEVTIILPGDHIIRCDHRAMTPEAAMDECEEKLKRQIEKLRTKIIG